MAAREQLIEKAARASHQEGLSSGTEYAAWDALRDRVRREYRENAAAVVDAILPQVTTVEELEALPLNTKVIDAGGEAWARYYLAAKGPRPLRWRNSRGGYGRTSIDIARCGPLTVVYQPIDREVKPINAGPLCEHGVCAGSGWYGSRWHNPDNYSPHLHCRCGAECGACASGDGFKRSGPSEPERTEVVDLVAALRASVEAARKRREQAEKERASRECSCGTPISECPDHG